MKRCKVLTLDVWDTILRRKCHPDEIKILTAKYLFLNNFDNIKEEFKDINILTKMRVESEIEIGNGKKSQENFDDEYRIEDVFTNLCEKVLKDKSKIDEVASNLYNAELNAEKHNIYLDPTIIDTINNIDHDKIAYISDFYANHEFIDELLKEAGFPEKFDYKFVSCECGYNKRSGKLFDFALKEMNIEAKDQIHIGDNEHSDYNIPKSKGIDSIRYLPEDEHMNREYKDRKFSERNKNNFDLHFNEKDFSIDSTSGKASICYYSFIQWIIDECKKKGIKKIYYFTREGEFFKSIHDEIVKNSPSYIELPKSYLLEVSRIATFGASLRNTSLEEMMRIWNQYSIQSMKAFFKSVNMNEELVSRYLKKYGIDCEEVITYPWLDERVQKMFTDEDFIEVFQNNIDTLKNGFIEYGKTRDLDPEEEESIAIVDIGWRGTIQDNICYLYENKHIYGYYFGLIDFLNEQPKNSEKFGFLNECPYAEVLLRYVTPFEMLCNSPNGSVIGYRKEGNIVKAIRKNDPCEDIIYEKYTKNIQKEVLSNIKILSGQTNTHGISADELKNIAYKTIDNIISNPPVDLAEAYFSLKHNEEFGVGKYIDKHTKFKPFLLIGSIFSKKKRNDLRAFLEETTWPQGYFTKYRLNIPLKLYNQRQEKKKMKGI